MSNTQSSSNTLDCDNDDATTSSSGVARISGSSRIIDSWTKYNLFTRSGLSTPSDPLEAMRTLLSTLCENDVPGPLMFRLHMEFNLELGKGTQFEVLGASKEFKALLEEATPKTPNSRFTKSSNDLRRSVVKRARGRPETSHRLARHKATSQDTLGDAIAEELDFQIESARSEIDKLCSVKHPNIVDLLGWGLCLDTFEGSSPLNARIPLLILERAQCNLREFIKSSSYSTISFEHLCEICFGVGNGLGALHAQKIAHGDLKLDNVLLFLTENGQQRPRWSAKLCDFGTAVSYTVSDLNVGVDANAPRDHTKLLYTGTEGWIPPEALTSGKMPPRMLQFCDLFVYGLILWCVFINSPDPPLGEDALSNLQGHDQIYRDAAKKVRNTWNNVPSPALNRVLQALRGSLREDPISRDRFPWRYLNYSNSRYINIKSIDESARSMPQNEESSRSRIMIAAQLLQLTFEMRFKGCKQRFRELLRIKSVSKPLLRSWFPQLWPINDWQLTYELLFEKHVRRQGIKEGSSKTTSFEHSESRCFEIQELCIDLWRACTGTGTPHSHGPYIYGCCRIRSRFKLCCWENALLRSRSKLNCLKELLSHPHKFRTLAWLCRGEIGSRELKEIQSLPKENEKLWSWTFSHEDKTERIARLTLFLEKGCYLGDKIMIDGVSKTVFCRFLEKLVDEARNHVESYDDVFQICKHFPRIAAAVSNANDDLSASSDRISEWRFFYRGESLDRMTRMGEVIGGKEDMFQTSAIHEAVLANCYSAVDYLFHTGFFVNARNSEGRTAMDLAKIVRQRYVNGWQIASITQIIGLLEKDQPRHNHYGLPLDWEAIDLENGKTVYTESTISPETCSMTFQTPTFSLLKERRLALGTKSPMGDGPTYHLDLVRFIRRPKLQNEALSPARDPIYTDQWYKTEISNTQELHTDPLLDRRRWYRVSAMIFNWLHVGFWTSQSVWISHILALVPLVSIFDFAISESSIRINEHAHREGFICGIFSCVTELSIGIFALVQGNIRFVQSMLIGNVICNNLLIFGGCSIVLGIRWHEFIFHNTSVDTMSTLTVFASTMSIILHFFHSFQVTPRNEDTTHFLSKTITILILTLYILWLHWRYRSHTDLFDEEYFDEEYLEEYGTHRQRNNNRLLARLPAIVVSIIGAPPILICSASLVSGMDGRSDHFQVLMGLFVIPIVLRLGKHTKAVASATKNNADYLIDLSLGFSLHTVLFLGPCLAIAGWIIGQPMILNFGLLETVIYGLTVWVVKFIVASGKSNYLGGSLLLVIYALSVSAILLLHQ